MGREACIPALSSIRTTLIINLNSHDSTACFCFFAIHSRDFDLLVRVLCKLRGGGDLVGLGVGGGGSLL